MGAKTATFRCVEIILVARHKFRCYTQLCPGIFRGVSSKKQGKSVSRKIESRGAAGYREACSAAGSGAV
jgi:hypothetical protein